MIKLLGESLIRSRIVTSFQTLFQEITKGERVIIKQKPDRSHLNQVITVPPIMGNEDMYTS